MRITGGKYRSRKIACPPGEIRPAMDRMRESLFSILGNLDSMSFLDLYSGSGIVGIEAASRGAEPVVLVEKDFKKKQTIMANISFVESKIFLFFAPVDRFVRKTTDRFDIIYLDPPFRDRGKEEILELVSRTGILCADGIAIIHIPSGEKLKESYGSLSLYDTRKYGGSTLRFYRKQETSPEAGG